MANATATKPDKAPKAKKKETRQPPADTVWLRYHPWMEGLVGHAASWAIHLVMIGIAVLCIIAYVSWSKHNQHIPVEAVSFAPAGGGGNPIGTGADRGNPAPQEGVHTNQNSSGDKTTLTDPNDGAHLDDVQPHLNDVSFAPPRLIQDNPDSMRSVAGLENALRDKLSVGNPSPGAGGPGTGGGNGTGTGPGTGPDSGPGARGVAKSERMKRMDRWEMSLQTTGSSDFLARLQMIGTTLAIPDDDNPDHMDKTKFTIVNLSKRPPEITKGADITGLNQIWWFIQDDPARGKNDARELVEALHLPTQSKWIVAFMNQNLENDLAKKEAAYTHVALDQVSARVAHTYFNVAVHGPGDWDVQVTGAKMK